MAEPLTVAQFRERFPEFLETDTSHVQAKLDEAWRRTPASVWGDTAQDAHGYLAAHLLALSPFGRDARMINEDGTTMYGKVRTRMEIELGAAAAPRVT